LESTAVLEILTLGVCATVGETGLFGAGPASARDTLLCVGAWCVEAREQAVAIDTDASVPAFEVELAAKGPRGGLLDCRLFFEGVETKAARCACRADRTFELLVALRDAADGRADFVDRAVGFSEAHRPRGRRLGFAFVPLAEEAAALTQRTVGDADVTLVVSAAGDREQRDEENPEAFHGRFDAGPWGLFTAAKGLKAKQFR
jgi:hypothetical protein